MSETEAVENAVRRLLEAARDGDDDGEAFCTPRLGRHLELVQRASKRGLVYEIRGSMKIARLQVVQIDGELATVDLDSHVGYRIRLPEGEKIITTRFRGPVRLVRVDGSWLVDELRQDGIGMSAALYEPPQAHAAAGPLEFIATARLLHAGTIGAVEVVNTGSRPGAVHDVAVEMPLFRVFRSRGVLKSSEVELAPGERLSMPFRLTRQKLPMTITVMGMLDGELVSRALRSPHAGLATRVRHLMSSFVILHLWVGVAAVFWAVTGVGYILGVMLLFSALSLLITCVSFLVMRSPSAAVAVYGAGAAVELALSIALLVSAGISGYEMLLLVAVLSLAATPQVRAMFRVRRLVG